MDFEVEEVGSDAVVITCAGRLNIVSAPGLREAVSGIISSGRPRVVVDLDAVEFIDSSGLGSLIGCLKTARQAHGDLRIARPTKQVLTVLQLSNIDRILRPYESPQAALQD